MRAVLLLALVAACSGLRSSERDDRPFPLVLDPDAPLPPAGECTWPGRIAAAAAIPAELAPQLEGLELIELRGDLRLSTAEVVGPRLPTAWSRDGNWLAFGESSGVFIWETATGALRAVFPLVPRRHVQAVALSADGEQVAFLASADADPYARAQALFVGPVTDIGRLRRFDVPGKEVQLRFSSDGTRLLTPRTIWDLASRRRIVAKATPYSSQLLPDGVRLVDRPLSRHSNDAVELRELSTGRVLRRFPVDLADRWFVSDDGSHLAIAGKAGIDVHALDSGHRVRRFPELALPASPEVEQGFLLSPDGSRLLISRTREDGTPMRTDTEMWDVQSGRRLWQAYLGNPGFWRFSDDGTHLLPAIGPSWGMVRVDDGTRLDFSRSFIGLSPDSRWLLLERARPGSGQPNWPELAPVDPVDGDLGIARAGWVVARSRDGTYTASLGADGQLQLESEAGCIALGISISLSDTRSSFTATFSADEQHLLVAHRSAPAAYAWRTHDGAAVRAVKGSGSVVALVGDTGRVLFSHPSMRRGVPVRRVFDLLAGHEMHYPAPTEPVLDPRSFGRQTAATHDGRQLYVAGTPALELVDLEEPSRNTVLDPRAALVSLSPDDRLVATATGPRVDIRTRIDWRPQIDVTHEQRVTGLAFSPDGERLASADEGGQVLVTRTLDGRRLAQLRVPHDRVKHLWLSPDGTELAVATARGLRVRARLALPAPGRPL